MMLAKMFTENFHVTLNKLCLIGAVALGGALTAHGGASKPAQGFSVIVAPAHIIVMQIAFDVVDQKPSVLVSYEPDGNASDPFLHVWNKTRWVPLSFDDYRSGAFMKKRPHQVIVLGDENPLTEVLLTSSQSWTPQSFVVPVTNARTVVNGLGQRFDFKMNEWRWFAQRYDLELVEVNARERDEVWYDQPNYFKGEDLLNRPPDSGNYRTAPRSTPIPASTRETRTGPTAVPTGNAAVTRVVVPSGPLPDPPRASGSTGRVTTLESVALPAAAEPITSRTTVISTGTISGQPIIVDEVKKDATNN